MLQLNLSLYGKGLIFSSLKSINLYKWVIKLATRKQPLDLEFELWLRQVKRFKGKISEKLLSLELFPFHQFATEVRLHLRIIES